MSNFELKQLAKVYYTFDIKGFKTDRLRYIGTDYEDEIIVKREGETIHYFTGSPTDDDEIDNNNLLALRTKGDRKCFSFVYVHFDGMYDSEEEKDTEIVSEVFV